MISLPHLRSVQRTASAVILAAVCAGGCAAPTAPTDATLVGTVRRGPIQPVCFVDISCDAPFSAGFTVQQGNRLVATFRSDAQGHFEVSLGVGAKSGNEAVALLHREAGTEWRIAGDVDEADRLNRTAPDGPDECRVSRRRRSGTTTCANRRQDNRRCCSLDTT